MKDNYGREINYMRISITDRCNLRCKYCLPEIPEFLPAAELLSYEEIMTVVRQAVALGITRFKVTGGEPLIREGAVSFITALKAEVGVEAVTLTTNGVFLEKYLPTLKIIGIDGINISCDAVGAECYRWLTGGNKNIGKNILKTAVKSAKLGIPTKINCVALTENCSEFLPLVRLAERENIDIRFIELMPLRTCTGITGLTSDEILRLLLRYYADLHPVMERRGNGPARYYAAQRLQGRIGIIDANSHRFCSTCNRIRLTSTGMLKPCLCSSFQYDIKQILRNRCDACEMAMALKSAVQSKPRQHCLEALDSGNAQIRMSQIGG